MFVRSRLKVNAATHQVDSELNRSTFVSINLEKLEVDKK
jgi:hypothetical protein